jgi:hypothetical protein
MSISFSRRKLLFTSASRSSVFALDFFNSLFGFGRGGRSAVLTLGRIQPPHHGIFSFRRRSSCSSMEKPSSSKCTGFSLTFARGLLWRQAAATCMDLWPRARWQCARVANFWLGLFQPTANAEDGKP